MLKSQFRGWAKRSDSHLSRSSAFHWVPLTLCIGLLIGPRSSWGQTWEVGFGKVCIDPNEPVRLSGYASRDKSHEGIADSLYVRAMVLQKSGESPTSASESSALDSSNTLLLVSADSILVSSTLTVSIAAWLGEKYGLSREQFVLCSTHSHAAPHLAGGLDNLFRRTSNAEETSATLAYTQQLESGIRAAVDEAMASRQSAKLEIGTSKTDVAINRRVIRNGSWTGFGEQFDGPVDQRVRVMLAFSPEQQLLGGAYLYACHCTTLGGDFNQVSGDWAGLSASRLENIHKESTFLPVIGCGADANPNPRGNYEFAQQHAAKLVDAVNEVVGTSNRSVVTSAPEANFGYAGLAPEQPTSQILEQNAQSERPNERRWSEHMRQVKNEMGRLPETYPMPIHTWRFGSELTWVFLGGEVVVDYQFQIEKELAQANTWVAAYTDDVFAYVASEPMRAEGGYEVDFSMIYYLQPGRWESGTQSLILRRVKEVLEGIQIESIGMSPENGLRAIKVPDDFRVELVASEPLVQDPINLAFGPDGSVWVVEMADYPLGVKGGGRVRRLRDTNGDGQFDQSDIFLSELDFPTSVTPWEDGVLVISAPDILFARDTDGDGKADQQEVWLTGIHAANPQHRASGFEFSLDGWLHFGAGDHTEILRSPTKGTSLQVRGGDVAWNPLSGELRRTTGSTQFVRTRDCYGNWFGNSNSRPIYQYVIDDHFHRGGTYTSARKVLLKPELAPRVLPRSATVDRFNDLFAKNRFTSACSAVPARVPGAGPRWEESAFICEPVHNLVARVELGFDGTTMTARRHPHEEQYDFFTSTDSWSRPVRVINAPDGSLWVVDMMRKVIEHPEWIPKSWQARLDVRSGSTMGRIYRVYHKDHVPFHPSDRWQVGTSRKEILAAIKSDNSVIRELGLQRLLWSDIEIAAPLREAFAQAELPATRIAVWGALAAKNWLRPEDWQHALADPDWRVVHFAIKQFGRAAYEGHPIASDTSVRKAFLDVAALANRNNARSSPLDLQWLLTASLLEDAPIAEGLEQIMRRSSHDQWIVQALELFQDPELAARILQHNLTELQQSSMKSVVQFITAIDGNKRLWKSLAPERKRELVLESLEVSGKHRIFQLMVLCLLADSPDLMVLKPVQSAVKQIYSRFQNGNVDEFETLTVVCLASGTQTVFDGRQAILTILNALQPTALKSFALSAWTKRWRRDAPSLLIECWPSLNSGERTQLCQAMLNNSRWQDPFVQALESGAIPREDLDASVVQQLRSLWNRDLRRRSMDVFGRLTPRDKVVARYRRDIPTPKSSAGGRQLFAENCATCHQSQDGQAQFGPALNNLKHWTLDQWIVAILDPNRNVEPKYFQTQLLTLDEQVLSGLVVGETESHLELAQSDGKVRSIIKSEIAERKRGTQSLMPEGLEQKISPKQLAELLGFLREGLESIPK